MGLLTEQAVVAIIFLLGSVTCILLLIRNHLVLKFIVRLIEEEWVFTRQRIDDGKGFDTFRRFDTLHQYRMTFMFWIPLRKYERPLSDFYKD